MKKIAPSCALNAIKECDFGKLLEKYYGSGWLLKKTIK